ncbi:hypothetical protein [Rhizobium phaseoli]|uniref:hypothetical protein n=1 Tax=Rhizobium phaseoli TaxID=396 RepID=UPI0007EA7D35|nr:hypothetical protein [Rhizobium phaseoli]
MQAFLNELSLDGQFSTSEGVVEVFRTLMRARVQHAILARELYCSRALPTVNGVAGETIAQTISRLPRDEKNSFLLWLANRGPFTDDVRTEEEDDLFQYEHTDVTDQGLGEAARREKAGRRAVAYSFSPGLTRQFDFSPLTVIQGWDENLIAEIELQNFWDVDLLAQALAQAEPDPDDWAAVIEQSIQRFPNLCIAEHIVDELRRSPFSVSLARNVCDLLSALNSVKTEMDGQGNLSPVGVQLVQKYFVGKNAWFTDESDRNKIDFESDMSFVDPITKQKITCFWHGKIQTPQFRIHFEWPVSDYNSGLKVCYIGPKITKR